MSHNEAAKQSNLFLSGWLTDNYSLEDGIGDIEPTESNEGMLGRNAWFRQDLQQGTDHPYSVEGYQMVAPLKHEIYGNRVLFPPSTKIMFTFTKASSAWYLMVPPENNDKERYKFHLSNCVLFVKVCTLNDHIYRSLVTRMEKEPIIIHYRRLAVKSEVLHSHSIFFESNNLFPDTTAPLRVYFALVKNKSLGDSYENNPYNFLRSLKVKPSPNVTGANPPFVSHEALHYKQLEIIQKQQEENQRIFQELHRLTVKEQKRKRKAREKRLKAKTIGQTDGNDSENGGSNSSQTAKGKLIPGKNVTKRSGRNKSLDVCPVSENNLETLQSTKSELVNLTENKNNDSPVKNPKNTTPSKRARKLMSIISDDSDTTDSDYDYSDSFINDESETSNSDSETSHEYDTAQSNVTTKPSTSKGQPNKSTISNPLKKKV